MGKRTVKWAHKLPTLTKVTGAVKLQKEIEKIPARRARRMWLFNNLGITNAFLLEKRRILTSPSKMVWIHA